MGDFRSEDPYLQKRYGIKPSRFPKWLPTAILLLIAGVSWTIWSGANHSIPEVRYNLISFNPISDKEISIRLTVNFKSEAKSHSCTLVARDYQANVVGEKVLNFPAGSKASDLTTQIATRVRAVNAGILGCQIR